MYVVLFCVVFLACLVVFPPSYLAEQVGQNAGISGFAELAWLTASLGTFAGAVGSGVSDREDILRATYGHREMERRLTREQTETQE